MNIFHKRQINGSRKQVFLKRGSRKMQSAIRNPHFFKKSAIRNGFTLIELLVVISIIVLLTGILLPTILRAKDLGYRAATRAYITTLENGALRYQQENQYFPGQEDTGLMAESSNENLYTGSQILISELMGIDRADDNDGTFKELDENPPSSDYVEYKEDKLILPDTPPKDNPNNYPEFTPIDSYPTSDACALLYYPSRLGNDGSISDAFEFDDNVEYTHVTDNNENTKTRNNFDGLIWDTRFGIGSVKSGSNETTWGTAVPNTGTGNSDNKAFNADTFLLFGKGLDDRDHAYSWFTPQSPKNFTSEGYTEED